MLRIEVPGREPLALEWLVLDVNGTIALDGYLRSEVRDTLASIEGLTPIAVTADTHGQAATMRAALGVEVRIVEGGDEAERKRAVVEELGAERVAAIGNGANDVGMLRAAALGICVLGPEGAAFAAMSAADVVCREPGEALGLLAHPARLVATLRR